MHWEGRAFLGARIGHIIEGIVTNSVAMNRALDSDIPVLSEPMLVIGLFNTS